MFARLFEILFCIGVIFAVIFLVRQWFKNDIKNQIREMQENFEDANETQKAALDLAIRQRRITKKMVNSIKQEIKNGKLETADQVNEFIEWSKRSNDG